MNLLFLKMLALGFLAAMSLMTITWLISVIKKNAGIVDTVWGMSFILLSIFYFMNRGGNGARRIVVLALVFIWGIRLSLHIFFRNRGKGEDFRYAGFREKAGPERYWLTSFFSVFLLQGFLATLISAPLLGAMMHPAHRFPGVFDVLGLLFWCIGFYFETLGDIQLKKFKVDPANRGKLLTSGLWKYTRHPNYFGDAMVWLGFGCFSIAAGFYIPVLGSVIMTFLLIRVSGVYLLEKSMKGTKKGYSEYIEKTPPFFPWFPKK